MDTTELSLENRDRHGVDLTEEAPATGTATAARATAPTTWQSVVLVDLNADNPHRRVRLTFLPG